MKKYIFFALISLVTCDVFASDFDVALNTVRTNCSGISEELSELKKMAGTIYNPDIVNFIVNDEGLIKEIANLLYEVRMIERYKIYTQGV